MGLFLEFLRPRDAQPVEYRRLENRIRELCTRAVATSDPAELNMAMQQLREALREHAKRLRRLAAAKLRQPPVLASPARRAHS